MSTETELVFWAMSTRELREAGEYIGALEDDWTRAHALTAFTVAKTDGPRQVLDAMEMAWYREVQRRFGGQEWNYPEPTTGHRFGALLDRYEQWALENGDMQLRLRAAVRQVDPKRTCQSCGTRYAADDPVAWPEIEVRNDDGGHVGTVRSTVCSGCTHAEEAKAAWVAEIDQQLETQLAEAGGRGG